MRKFVINLKRRPDRLEKFFERCPLKEIEVVEAFDAKFPHLENQTEQTIFNGLNLRKPGERGVFISHLRIWKKIVNEDLPGAVIFEDDAQFSKKFLSTFEQIKSFKGNLVFLGGRFEDNFIMPKTTSKDISKFLTRHNYNTWIPRYHDRTAHAYIISRDTAKIFLELFGNLKVPEPVDHFIVKSLRDLNIQVYSSVPLVCWSPLVGDSDIR